MTNAARDDLLRPDDCDEARAVGFIVHPTWYVRAGVTEIHLYGRLSSGETFLVIDTRTRPRFYLRASEAQQGHGRRRNNVVHSQHPKHAWSPTTQPGRGRHTHI